MYIYMLYVLDSNGNLPFQFVPVIEGELLNWGKVTSWVIGHQRKVKDRWSH